MIRSTVLLCQAPEYVAITQPIFTRIQSKYLPDQEYLHPIQNNYHRFSDQPQEPLLESE